MIELFGSISDAPSAEPVAPDACVSPRWGWLLAPAALLAALAWTARGGTLFHAERVIAEVLAAGLLIVGAAALSRQRWTPWALFLAGAYATIGGCGAAGQSLGVLRSGAALTAGPRAAAAAFVGLGIVWLVLGPLMMATGAAFRAFGEWSAGTRRVVAVLFAAIGLWQLGLHYADRARHGQADWALDRALAAQHAGDRATTIYWHGVLHRAQNRLASPPE